MTITNFTPETFSIRMLEIQTGLVEKKWVNASLEIQDRDNGFIRFLKVLVLPIARLFNCDPYAHVRADKVAFAILSEYTKHENKLTLEDRKIVSGILSFLHAETGVKYQTVMAIAASYLNGSIETLRADLKQSPVLTETPLENKDLLVNTEETPTTHTSYLPNDYHHSFQEIVPQKLLLNFGMNDDLKEVFGPKPKIIPSDQQEILQIYNSPIRDLGLKNLALTIDVFIDGLDSTASEDDELQVDEYDSCMSQITQHKILAKFYLEYPKIPGVKNNF